MKKFQVVAFRPILLGIDVQLGRLFIAAMHHAATLSLGFVRRDTVPEQHPLGSRLQVFGVNGLICQACVESLCDTEVNHFGYGVSILLCDKYVAGLDIAVNNTFLVRMLYRSANLYEQR